MPEIVGCFKKGEAIPEWMIEVDPMPGRPDRRSGPAATFMQDVAVIEFADYFALVPMRFDGAENDTIHLRRSGRIRAGGKSVVWFTKACGLVAHDKDGVGDE